MSFSQTSIGIMLGESHFNEKSQITPSSFDVFEKDFKAGWYAGVFADFKLKGNFYIRPEISYIQKGYSNPVYFAVIDNNNVEFENPATMKHIYQYIEMPILFNLKIPFGTRHSFGIGVGPSIGFLFGKEKSILKYDDGKLVTTSNHELILTDDTGNSTSYKYNRIDLGISTDLHYRYGMGKTGGIRVGMKYFQDFTNQLNLPEELQALAAFEAKYTNFGLAFYVGYDIRLKE